MVLAILLVALAFAVVFTALAARDRLSSESLDQLTEFSSEKYKPMEMLLSEREYRFLASQPGFTPEIGNRFRADRRRVFRGYLKCLRQDFNRIYLVTKVLLVYSDVQRPELLRQLLFQRIRFAVALLRVEARLATHRIGLGAADARVLVESLEAMHIQVRELMAKPLVA
ncbi:MAG: hypothetical protein ACRD96_01670 [Bryobacteraceae bacterium]